MKIDWTDEAVSDLEDVFDHYLNEASLQVAQRMVNKIIDATDYLKNNPKAGQVEAMLSGRELEFRY